MNAPLHPFPFLEDLEGYRPGLLRRDLLAGLTVTVFAVPQAMAYAMLAGVPAVNGIYAAIVMSIVAALWGSSPFVNTGPTNSAALLTAAAMIPWLTHPHMLQIVYALTLLAGLLRLVMGLMRLGRVVDFVPESAFLGFTFGAGVLIALGPIHLLLNVDPSTSVWLPARVWDALRMIPHANPFSVAIGLGVALLTMALRMFSRRIPAALTAILLAAAFTEWVVPGQGVRLVRDLAPVPSGLPRFAMPHFDLPILVNLLPAALALAVVGLIEAVSIGQTLALRHGQSLNVNQEFVGQGLSHVVGAFFQGIPGSASFARSKLVEQAGGQTRCANVFFGLCLLAIVLLVPGLLNRIPVAALAGLLIYIGISLIDLPRAARVWATCTSDAYVLAATFLTTVLVRVEYGIFVGIGGAALMHVNRSRILHMDELLPTGEGGFDEVPYGEPLGHEPSDVVAVELAGDLTYGVAGAFRSQLKQIIAAQRPRFLILRVRHAYSIDYSCWSVLFDIAEAFHAGGGSLYLCGVRPDIDAVIDQARMRDVLPREHIFTQDAAIYQAFAACLQAANTQLGHSRVLAAPWRRYFQRDGDPRERDRE